MDHRILAGRRRFRPQQQRHDTNDQLYWQVAPAEMPVPLGEVTARVEVAPDLMGALDGRTRCLIGASYDDTECELTQDGTAFSAAATFDEAREGMTFVLGFHEGTFQRPWIPHEHFWSYNAVGLGMLVGTAGVVWAWIRSARGMRKPSRGTVVAPQVRPPKKLGLRVAGTVVNAKPANITAAEVLGLAITGSLTVSEKDDTIILERTADPSGEAYALGLRHFHEGLRRTTEIPLVGRSEGLRGAVRASAHEAKRQAKPYLRWNPWPSVLLAVLAALVVLAFVFQGSDFRTDNPPAVTLLVVAPLIIFIPVAAVFWAARATRLTREGKEVLRDLAGLRWLIEMSEAERLRWLQSPDTAPRERIGGDEREVLRLYETLLPWAALFGHQHEWSDLLRNHAAAADLPDVDYGWTTTLTMPAWDTGLAAVGTGSTLDSGGSGGGSYDGGGFSGGSDVGGGGGGGGGSFD
ncbi:DUF2207 domain-containing protein [Parenemella sanctibonifatiensis]|uniref:Predicted membrane protein YciQ-like C-terminal domain-containing protein n=1 Tax=Parenemella sanctibonifatiensis TaxID=2016505 RepID=A0A255EG40_9ACTN|nr:DUF2207 domain-containing protein [Parenemella sanctibonifatiensis]OYN90499.1 hypothetical protein CGZ92_01320 [Parenemella sanctibonifatiensis]